MNEEMNLTERLFYDNEIRTNRLVVFPIMFLGALLITLVVLSVFGVYNLGGVLPRHGVLFAGLLCLTTYPVASHFKYQAKWIKQYYIDVILFTSCMNFFLFPHTGSFLHYGPILVAALYYNRKTIRRTAVGSWILYGILLWLNVYLELHSVRIHNYHAWLGIDDILCYPDEIFADHFIPQTVYFIITTIICDAIAKRGREFVINKATITSEVTKIENELSAATNMQLSSLPGKHSTFNEDKIIIEAFMRPAKAVGGDFYDYFVVDDNLVFLVADVSDKGFPAAMFMMKAKNAVRSAFHTKKEFEEVVEIANFLMYNDNNENMFTTMWIASINMKTGVGKYANCGHLYPFVRHQDGSVSRIENEPDLMLGVFENPQISTHLLKLTDGDTLIAFTDGLPDAVNHEGERFGEDRLYELIKNLPKIDTSTGGVLIGHIDKYVGDTNQFDDMTSLGVHFTSFDKPEEDVISLKAETVSSTILNDTLNELLDKNGCPDFVRRNINVSIDEVCENIKEYAYNDSIGEYSVRYLIGKNYLEIEFIDDGAEFNPLEEKTEPFDDLQIGGLGIHLYTNIMDDVRYERINDKNHLLMIKCWSI